MKKLVFIIVLLAILCPLAHILGAEPSPQLRQAIAQADLNILVLISQKTQRMARRIASSIEDRMDGVGFEEGSAKKDPE